jgi:hypothetical protein
MILLDKKRRRRAMITPEKGKEKANEHFTDGVSFGGGERQRRRRWVSGVLECV